MTGYVTQSPRRTLYNFTKYHPSQSTELSKIVTNFSPFPKVLYFVMQDSHCYE